MADAFPFFKKHKDLLFLKRTGNQPEYCEVNTCLEGEGIVCNLATFSAYEQGHGYPQSELMQVMCWRVVLENPCLTGVSPVVNGLWGHAGGSWEGGQGTVGSGGTVKRLR